MLVVTSQPFRNHVQPCSISGAGWSLWCWYIKYIVDITVPHTPGNTLGINTNLEINAWDRYIFKIFSLTALKQVTRLWKQAKSPDLQAWYQTKEQTLEMENSV
jgi:hypothetical protein